MIKALAGHVERQTRGVMKPVICPTVTAINAVEYNQQMKRLAGFAKRVHIDIVDGMFTRVRPMSMKDIWWPDGAQVDMHLTCEDPLRHTRELLQRKPKLVIVHAEAKGDLLRFAEVMRDKDIAFGIALKPETSVKYIEPALGLIDHVLIFSGRQGHLGTNLHLMTKVLHLRQLKPSLEIGWEGGINSQNAAVLAAGGVDVLNVGGLAELATDPQAAYKELKEAIRSLPPRHKQL